MVGCAEVPPGRQHLLEVSFAKSDHRRDVDNPVEDLETKSND
ncbi:MAG: hypothetical protein JWM11_5128 [Planctomycetaceae bacterium]|nr:hypothetical protein [Planctomycetaceae bacterium]